MKVKVKYTKYRQKSGRNVQNIKKPKTLHTLTQWHGIKLRGFHVPRINN